MGVKAQDFNIEMTCYVNRFIFYHIVQGVKLQCIEDTTKLVKELQAWFLHVFNEAFIFVYPHYWTLANCDEFFNNHVNVVKSLFCLPKKMKVGEVE